MNRVSAWAAAWMLCVAALLGTTADPRNVVAAATHQPSPKTPDIGFAPTPSAVVDAMLKLARVTADDVVYDLGSGDGRIVIQAAERYGARSVGVEIDADLVRLSREAARERGVADKVTFVEGDLFTTDVSGATVVMLYLSPTVHRRLEPKLKRELRPGTRVVSHWFAMPNWAPTEKVRAPDGTDLLLFIVPRPPLRPPDTEFAPTPQAVADAMLKLARVGPDDVVYDLGSGDGRIVILAAQEYGARGVGVELDPPLVERSRQIALDGGVTDRVTFVEGDLFTADISKATVVILALSPVVNARLEAKLRRELPPGARIVSRRYGLGGWTPDETLRAEDGTDLFLYRKPQSSGPRPRSR